MTDTFAGIAGISDRVVDALAAKGFDTPFPIQRDVIPLALDGGDVLAQAPTGSGKTLGFGIPMLERIAALPEGDHPAGLVLVPTRELAVQVEGDLAPLAAALGLRIALAYGGAGLEKQAKDCAHADVVVATPGRLQDLAIDRRAVRLDQVAVLVLDEADRMLDMGFAPQVEKLIRLLPSARQTMLFSATLDGTVSHMVERHTRSPRTVRVEPDHLAGRTIEHLFEPTEREQRLETLVRILDGEPRDLVAVFVRTKHGADRLNRKLKARGLKSTAIHGGMTQSARLRELGKFQQGERDVLVATDVFARGIDCDGITHVVNFDLPGDADTYMHRVGRTGRAGRSGTGITLVAPEQWDEALAMAKAAGLEADD